jgi:hypothetical protein
MVLMVPVGYLKPYQGKITGCRLFLLVTIQTPQALKLFSVWDGGNWQSIGSQCDLNYGFSIYSCF